MENVVLEPPLYFANDHIFNLDFHPNKDFLTASLITGEVKILSYNSDDVKELANLTHHQESCRSSFFSDDGNILATISKDKSYGIVDANGVLQIHIQNAHSESINAGYFLNNETLATGDDKGCIKVWDLRNPKQSIFNVGEQEETISDLVSTDNNHYLLASGLDGTLGVYDLRKSNNSDAKLYALSDCMDEDLNSVCLIKNQQFVASSTSEGAILLFKWDYFGDFKDRVLGHPNSIDAMIKYDENTLITGSEDGFVRAVSIYPNDITAILGQHEEDENFPVCKLSMSHCRKFLASCSHDSSIKFYDISHLDKIQQNHQMNFDDEDFEEESKTNNSQRKSKLYSGPSARDQGDDEEDSDMSDEGMYDDDDDDDSDDDSDDFSDEEDNNKQKKKKKKEKVRKMAKGKTNMKIRESEINREKRMNFFNNM